MTSVQELEALITSNEGERLEFKAAKNAFNFDKLADYCTAIANERGGKLLLGISDEPPRQIVGTSAFPNLSALKLQLLQRLSFRVDAEELDHPAGRVVILHVPSRPLGTAVHHNGRYLMRAGESLVSMSSDQLRRIHDEIDEDFSGTSCHGATIDDLAPEALAAFREAWIRKSGNENLRSLDTRHLLSDAGIAADDQLTYAALILLGTHSALAKYLPQAEVIFEWRDAESRIEYQDRREFRSGVFLWADEIWQAVNARNTRQQFREGLFVRDIATFNETAVREAILNAIAHRDYRSAGSVFIRQSPTTIEIESPGGFPRGVTAENLLFKQVPRNRRLSEALARVGLVERSGQGIDRMYETSIREGKEPPDFSRTDDYHVSVVLRGAIQDGQFLRFLETLSEERSFSISTSDLIVLDRVHRGQPISDELRKRLPILEDNGVIEHVGRGRATRYILSKRFYDHLGRPGAYTRKRGLDRQTNKELLVRHIEQNQRRGSSFAELADVLPSQSKRQVKALLQELKNEGRIRAEGATRSARWYPGLDK